MAEPSSNLSLKLVIDRKSNKVVFAEAGKDVVVFLRSILTLTLGTVTELLPEQGMVGCLSNLNQSINNLNDDSNGKDAFMKGKMLYMCPTMTEAVMTAVTYIVMDDLVVSPTSSIISVSFLKKLNVDFRSLEEKVVDLDMDKGLKLLNASFQTKNVLTEVFLKGQDNVWQKWKTGCFVVCRTFVYLILVIFLIGFIGNLAEK